MDHVFCTCCLAIALLISAEHHLLAEHPAPGEIRIADRPDERFVSIRSAIDAAPAGATVLIGEGRYDERLKIGKPIKLVGTGPNKTVIGPTAEARQSDVATFRVQQLFTGKEWQQWLHSGKTPGDPKKRLAWAEMVALSAAVINIKDAQGVELQSLQVTSPGLPDADGGSDQGFHAIELKSADLRMTDCAVVGCLGDGVNAQGESTLEIDDCLIGGCWNNGVTAVGQGPMRLRIVNSDVRNCYRMNICVNTPGHALVVEGCRISGSGGWGIHCWSKSTIVRSAIWANQQVGIEAMKDAVIKQNLICNNRMRGVVCWTKTKSTLEGNLFMENENAICASGESETTIRRNVFVAGPVAVEYQPHGVPGGVIPATRTYHVEENVFWRINQPVVRRDLVGKERRVQTEFIELAAADNNRVEDPRITLGSDGQIFLAEDSPVGQIDFTGITAATMKTRWPLTNEERAMIPADGSRDVSKWKLPPAAPDR
jgi:hypothetical protein